MEKIFYSKIDTEIGKMWAATSKKGLIHFHYSGSKEEFINDLKKQVDAELVEEPSLFNDLKNQLDRYFNRELLRFNIPFDMRGTEFQKQVWEAISVIPFGKLSSYGRIAKEIGRPKAARAVGNAVGSNPVGLLIPCHRVVGSNGGLGGFKGGLDMKRRFLFHEGILTSIKENQIKSVDLKQFFITLEVVKKFNKY